MQDGIIAAKVFFFSIFHALIWDRWSISSANLQMRWGVAWLRLAALYDCMYFVVTTYAYFSSSHLSWQKSSSASTCQIFNSFSHDVVVKNWNCCREQLQIGSKLLSWTPTRFEIISDYWRNFPFIVPRDFFFFHPPFFFPFQMMHDLV